MVISELFEILMIILFGCSWPVNVMKSYKSRTAKGKSLVFLLLISLGYVFGIMGKLISGNYKWYVLFFYFLNLVMVLMDVVLFFRNITIEKQEQNKVGT